MDKQPFHISQRIVQAIEQIPEGDIIKLQNKEGYRLRVGSYRVLFNRSEEIVFVKKIDNRGDVYKGGMD